MKRPYKKRNPEATRQALVSSVGTLLADQGHQGLGVNKVADLAGVNKKMIYWYFNSYNNLLKTYIKSRDFWRPVLGRFKSTEPPLPEAVPGYISDIFLEQFESFNNNDELQKMILWQISESNPTLREVSDEREAQAEPIARLSDEHFQGSDINFRAVLALVLGGIYYVIWHSKSNKSKVCGIDINEERDRIAFQKAIRQVIDAVWKAADANRDRK